MILWPSHSHRTSQSLPVSTASQCFSASLRKYHNKREAVFGFFSRRLFKAASCIIKKCFHQAISSLPSCAFYYPVLGSTPRLWAFCWTLCTFALLLFSVERAEDVFVLWEEQWEGLRKAGPRWAVSFPSPHEGQTEGVSPQWVRQGCLSHHLNALSVFSSMWWGCIQPHLASCWLEQPVLQHPWQKTRFYSQP